MDASPGRKNDRDDDLPILDRCASPGSFEGEQLARTESSVPKGIAMVGIQGNCTRSIYKVMSKQERREKRAEMMMIETAAFSTAPNIQAPHIPAAHMHPQSGA